MTKYFILTCGPTGSGKTGLVKATLTTLGVSPDTPVTKFLIDDLVENDQDYKRLVLEILDQIDVTCKKDVGCEELIFNNPSKELFDQFDKAYYDVRQGIGHLGCNTFRDEGENCDKVLDHRLKQISVTKPSVVVFETQGTSIPEWLFDEKFIPPGYDIIVSYSLVHLQNLVERNKTRAFQSVQQFRKNTSGPAPRLPNVSKEAFIKKVSAIKKTLKQLYTSCIQTHQENICGSVKINRLLLFDNNGDSHKLIYDISPGEVVEGLDSAIDSALEFNLEGGHTKKRIKKHTKKRGKKHTKKVRVRTTNKIVRRDLQ